MEAGDYAHALSTGFAAVGRAKRGRVIVQDIAGIGDTGSNCLGGKVFCERRLAGTAGMLLAGVGMSVGAGTSRVSAVGGGGWGLGLVVHW